MHQITGVDVLLIALLLFGAVWIVIRNTVDDAENAKVCADCPVCKGRRLERANQRRADRRAATLRAGRCPDCLWFLGANGYCAHCGEHKR